MRRLFITSEAKIFQICSSTNLNKFFDHFLTSAAWSQQCRHKTRSSRVQPTMKLLSSPALWLSPVFMAPGLERYCSVDSFQLMQRSTEATPALHKSHGERATHFLWHKVHAYSRHWLKKGDGTLQITLEQALIQVHPNEGKKELSQNKT